MRYRPLGGTGGPYGLRDLGFYVSGASAVLIGVGGIEIIGPVGDSGTGFGNVSNILSLQQTGTETGSISWNGTSDISSGDAKNTSKTWLFSDIIAKGITDATQLGIIYNVSLEGKDSALKTQLNSFTLEVYNLSGGLEFATTGCVGCGPSFNYPPIAQGTGGAGYLFDLNPGAESLQGFYFDNPTLYRLGATGSVSLANDGPDNFFFAKISGVTPVPEPVSMLLFGTGLVGIGGYRRKKFKQN